MFLCYILVIDLKIARFIRNISCIYSQNVMMIRDGLKQSPLVKKPDTNILRYKLLKFLYYFIVLTS